jgi:hypothetical protein
MKKKNAINFKTNFILPHDFKSSKIYATVVKSRIIIFLFAWQKLGE